MTDTAEPASLTPELPELGTERLVLRGWRAVDREPYAALNADPKVMAHFPAPLDRVASDAHIDRIADRVATSGFGLWAVEVAAPGGPVPSGTFIGFVGLNPVPDDLPPAPAVEVGWRLARTAWGQGYATEAALASLDFAFTHLRRLPDGDHATAERLAATAGPAGEPLAEVVSFTSPGNERSRRVMAAVEMTERPERAFEHPRAGAHVLYAIDRPT